MEQEPILKRVYLYPQRGSFAWHYNELQDMEVENAIEVTGWTGVGRYAEWSWNTTDAYWDYMREVWNANLLTACRVSGHNMTPIFEDMPGLLHCTNCGRCNEPECCPDLYPSSSTEE